ASLTGDMEKKAKLFLAEEKEAALKEMVMVIGDTYMSKRDLWQLQLAMMQHKGRLIYRGFRQNFCEHVPSSSIDKLVSADGKAAACGMVGVKTDVAFRSSSTHMFLLIEVSAELFSFGLFGRYYWEVLLECFGQVPGTGMRGAIWKAEHQPLPAHHSLCAGQGTFRINERRDIAKSFAE
ncbi:cdc48, partial [Symbiodinium necroappetens]